MNELRSDIVMVTPATARDWLELNHGNRKPTQRLVKQHVRRLETGRWQVTNDAISFDVEGNLVNGQHRLMAIVEADIPALCLVVWGLPKGSFPILDTGKSRSFKDLLESYGVPNAAKAASVTQLVAHWESHGEVLDNSFVKSNGISGRADQDELLFRYQEDRYALQEAVKAGRRINDAIGISATWWGGLMFFASRIDPADASGFEYGLRTGDTLDGRPLHSSHPVRALRERVRKAERDREFRHFADRREFLALAVKSWNAYRQGRDVERLRFRVGGANPEKFPRML